MKQQFFKSMFVATAMAAAIQFSACKGKKTEATATDTTQTQTDTATVAAPVTIAPDDQLTRGVKDATKDFPGVTAAVDSGVVTLTGTITRDKLPNLMMSLNSLHPKKIDNKLTINK